MANIVDPVQAFAAFTAALDAQATSTGTTTSKVSPIPTVVPSLPEYQTAGETGERTLW